MLDGLISFFKVGMALFPFIKEYFTVKGKQKKKKPPPGGDEHAVIRKALVALGVAGVVGCGFLGNELYISHSELKLLREREKSFKSTPVATLPVDTPTTVTCPDVKADEPDPPAQPAKKRIRKTEKPKSSDQLPDTEEFERKYRNAIGEAS